jgi:hypothetical protein
LDQDLGPQGLMGWEQASHHLEPALVRILAEPAMIDAVRALASNMLDLAARDRALDAVFKDAGRYVATMWAFSLHENGGLTLPRLKDVCLRSGLLSPGRARALLQFLEHLRYVERRAAPRGGVIYEPTEAFLGAWDAQLRAALEAGRVLEPEVALILDRSDPAALRTFGRLHAESLLGTVSDGQEPPSFLRVFLHPHAGAQIFWTLFVAADGTDFPPHRAGPISVSGLSRRFGVSRIHIKRIFEEAAREGLAYLDRDGVVRFEEAARQHIQFLYGMQLIEILSAAARAVRAHGLAEPSDGDQKGAIVTVGTAA